MKASFWLGSGVILNVHLAQNALELVDLRFDVDAEVLRIVADRDIPQVGEPFVDRRHVEHFERRAGIAAMVSTGVLAGTASPYLFPAW
jgi:hypothetical protein